MAFNQVQEIIVGTVGRINELRELSNDNAVINFSLAVTPRHKQGNEYVDGETIWTNCVIWGKDARTFASNQFQPGTQLMVMGRRTATRRKAYTNKDGNEIPERVEQELNVDTVAAVVNPFSKITVTKTSKNGSQGQARPAQQATSTPASAPQSQQPAADPFASDTNVADPFADAGGDPFADGDIF